MSSIVKSISNVLFGGGQAQAQGPSAAELAAQQARKQKAFDDTAEANQLSALSSRQSARSRALRFVDERKKQSLGA